MLFERRKYLNRLIAGRDNGMVKIVTGVRELVSVMASGIGASCNPKRIADTFKSAAQVRISDQTIKEYIGHLKDAFLHDEHALER